MPDEDLRDRIRAQIESTDAGALLPHQRRDALLVLKPDVDLLDVAEAITADDNEKVGALLESGELFKPSLAQMSDWLVDLELRFQFVILQPYVLAQRILEPVDESGAQHN